VNAKLWACVIMGVLVAHLCVLFIVDNIRNAKRPPRKPPVPTFETSTTTFMNPQGEKVKIVNEFTVQTELAPPEVLQKLPAPPKADTAN
jgi:hypothetical protein